MVIAFDSAGRKTASKDGLGLCCRQSGISNGVKVGGCGGAVAHLSHLSFPPCEDAEENVPPALPGGRRFGEPRQSASSGEAAEAHRDDARRRPQPAAAEWRACAASVRAAGSKQRVGSRSHSAREQGEVGPAHLVHGPAPPP